MFLQKKQIWNLIDRASFFIKSLLLLFLIAAFLCKNCEFLGSLIVSDCQPQDQRDKWIQCQCNQCTCGTPAADINTASVFIVLRIRRCVIFTLFTRAAKCRIYPVEEEDKEEASPAQIVYRWNDLITDEDRFHLLMPRLRSFLKKNIQNNQMRCFAIKTNKKRNPPQR